MSYDIELVDPVSRRTLLLDVPHQMRGGTYCQGGTIECHLNVTYNYDRHYVKVLGEKAFACWASRYRIGRWIRHIFNGPDKPAGARQRPIRYATSGARLA